jgi:hypothetical protein
MSISKNSTRYLKVTDFGNNILPSDFNVENEGADEAPNFLIQKNCEVKRKDIFKSEDRPNLNSNKKKSHDQPPNPSPSGGTYFGCRFKRPALPSGCRFTRPLGCGFRRSKKVSDRCLGNYGEYEFRTLVSDGRVAVTILSQEAQWKTQSPFCPPAEM